jgi:hypothetical protein
MIFAVGLQGSCHGRGVAYRELGRAELVRLVVDGHRLRAEHGLSTGRVRRKPRARRDRGY